jgi:hypothetical protein
MRTDTLAGYCSFDDDPLPAEAFRHGRLVACLPFSAEGEPWARQYSRLHSSFSCWDSDAFRRQHAYSAGVPRRDHTAPTGTRYNERAAPVRQSSSLENNKHKNCQNSADPHHPPSYFHPRESRSQVSRHGGLQGHDHEGLGRRAAGSFECRGHEDLLYGTDIHNGSPRFDASDGATRKRRDASHLWDLREEEHFCSFFDDDSRPRHEKSGFSRSTSRKDVSLCRRSDGSAAIRSDGDSDEPRYRFMVEQSAEKKCRQRPQQQTQEDKTVYIRIGSGVQAKLQRSEETMKAVQRDFYAPATCFGCFLSMFAVANVRYVVCPQCMTISPSSTTSDDTQDHQLSLDNDGDNEHIAGIGFTQDLLHRARPELKYRNKERNY